MLLISCGQPEDQKYRSDGEYPFKESSKKNYKDLVQSKAWIKNLTNVPENYQKGLIESVIELIPYEFTDKDEFQIGELDLYADKENVRYQVVIQINRRMKVFIEVYDKKQTRNKWDWMRVSAYFNSYRYLKTYNNDQP